MVAFALGEACLCRRADRNTWWAHGVSARFVIPVLLLSRRAQKAREPFNFDRVARRRWVYDGRDMTSDGIAGRAGNGGTGMTGSRDRRRAAVTRRRKNNSNNIRTKKSCYKKKKKSLKIKKIKRSTNEIGTGKSLFSNEYGVCVSGAKIHNKTLKTYKIILRFLSFKLISTITVRIAKWTFFKLFSGW